MLKKVQSNVLNMIIVKATLSYIYDNMKVASPFQKKAKGKKRKFLSQLSNSWGV